MERRKISFYVAVFLLMIGIIISSFEVRIKNKVNNSRLDSNLEIETFAINSINDELKYKYLKIGNNLPTINFNIENKKTEKDNSSKRKIISEKKVTKKKIYGTNKITTTIIKYEQKDNRKKQISKTSTTKYEVSNELLKKANKWYSEESSYMQESIKYINNYRNKAKKSNVKLDKKLCIAAYIRAYEIAKSSKFSHTRPENRKCFTVLKDLKINYYYAGENLAMGSFDSPENVVNAWAYSKKHYENMIISQYKKVGLAYIKVGDTYYWAQLFTN